MGMIVNQKELIHLKPPVNHKPIGNINDYCTPSAVSLIAKVMCYLLHYVMHVKILMKFALNE